MINEQKVQTILESYRNDFEQRWSFENTNGKRYVNFNFTGILKAGILRKCLLMRRLRQKIC